jgi:hypothetical protein
MVEYIGIFRVDALIVYTTKASHARKKIIIFPVNSLRWNLTNILLLKPTSTNSYDVAMMALRLDFYIESSVNRSDFFSKSVQSNGVFGMVFAVVAQFVDSG